MAVLTLLKTSEAGLDTTTLPSAAAGGDSFANSPENRICLFVKNTDASAHTVTVTAQNTPTKKPGFGTVTKADSVVAVPASEERLIGPFPADAFNDVNGSVQITYSAETGMQVAPVLIPGPADQ